MTDNSWVLVLPIIQAGPANRCLASMHESVRERTLVVDNSDTGIAVPVTGKRVEAGRNLGVARSWNLGIDYMQERQASMLWICSSSVRFGVRAGLDLFDAAAQADETGIGALEMAWHLTAFRSEVFYQVGTFDEHFYPAYYEDTDFLYRMGLAGLASPRENGRSWPYFPIQGKAENGVTVKSGAVKPDFQFCEDYYVRKWGGKQGEERFTVPFGLSTFDGYGMVTFADDGVTTFDDSKLIDWKWWP